MARHLRDKYQNEVKTKEGITKLTKSKVEQPLMLGVVDEQGKKFLIALRKKRGGFQQSGHNCNCKSFDFS